MKMTSKSKNERTKMNDVSSAFIKKTKWSIVQDGNSYSYIKHFHRTIFLIVKTLNIKTFHVHEHYLINCIVILRLKNSVAPENKNQIQKNKFFFCIFLCVCKSCEKSNFLTFHFLPAVNLLLKYIKKSGQIKFERNISCFRKRHLQQEEKQSKQKNKNKVYHSNIYTIILTRSETLNSLLYGSNTEKTKKKSQDWILHKNWIVQKVMFLHSS